MGEPAIDATGDAKAGIGMKRPSRVHSWQSMNSNGRTASTRLSLRHEIFECLDNHQWAVPIGRLAKNGASCLRCPDCPPVRREQARESPMMQAARAGSGVACELLLRSVDPNLRSAIDGSTALMVAIESGHDAVAKLLAEPTDTSILDANGSSALRLAAALGRLEVMAALLPFVSHADAAAAMDCPMVLPGRPAWILLRPYASLLEAQQIACSIGGSASNGSVPITAMDGSSVRVDEVTPFGASAAGAPSVFVFPMQSFTGGASPPSFLATAALTF